MSRKKRFAYILLFSLPLFFMAKGWLFRASVKYKIIDQRPTIAITDDLLQKYIDSETGKRPLALDQIAEVAIEITNRELHFSTSSTLINPNIALRQGQTNCIGYSAAFNSICQYLIDQHQLADQFRSKHLAGQLKLFGGNLHQLFDDPFWADHDFNLLENLKTREKIYVDPTLSDYLWIDRVEKEE